MAGPATSVRTTEGSTRTSTATSRRSPHPWPGDACAGALCNTRHRHRAGGVAMHVQVVTYGLAEEMSDADFIDANQEFAEAMAAVPGLLAKIWLKNADQKVYGGVYLWRDREAYDAFVAGDLWGSVLT